MPSVIKSTRILTKQKRVYNFIIMIFNSNPTFTEKSTLSFYPESPVKRASRIPSGTPSTCDRD